MKLKCREIKYNSSPPVTYLSQTIGESGLKKFKKKTLNKTGHIKNKKIHTNITNHIAYITNYILLLYIGLINHPNSYIHS